MSQLRRRPSEWAQPSIKQIAVPTEVGPFLRFPASADLRRFAAQDGDFLLEPKKRPASVMAAGLPLVDSWFLVAVSGWHFTSAARPLVAPVPVLFATERNLLL
jgi:hypothetical protein